MKIFHRVIMILVILLPMIIGLASDRSICSEYLSPISVVADNDAAKFYVAESAAGRIDIIDIAAAKTCGTVNLPQNPSGLILSPEGKSLYATGDDPQGKLFVIDLKKNKIVKSLLIGHTPMSPVINKQGTFVYLCVRFDNKIAVVDTSKKKVTAQIEVKREPVACGLSKDETKLFVANHLPAGPANTNNIAAEVEVIDTTLLKVVRSIILPNGSSSLRGLCVSQDGKYVYVTHLLSRYTMPTTQLERGWMNTNAFSIIDAEKMELINTVLLDDLTEGAANPWAVTCSADGKYLCITHAGTNEVSIINRSKLHEKLELSACGKLEQQGLKAQDVPNTLAFLGTMRQRLKLNIKGPRGCISAGSNLFVTGYFSDSAEVINLAQENYGKTTVIALSSKPAISEIRYGEMLFSDADMCFQKWQSCASCHPDGRADGLNWDLLNDGIGNSKNNKSMLYSHKTPPAMVSGVRDKAETAVRAGIKFIQFMDRPESDAKALDAYLMSLRPVQSPYLQNGKLTESAQRGEKIFEKAGCAACHSGKYLTDLNSYDVGIADGSDKGIKFDTPTLIEVWRTAPYLYDGRAVTIEEVIIKYNQGDKHGVTSDLTPQEIKDLSEYVLSR